MRQLVILLAFTMLCAAGYYMYQQHLDAERKRKKMLTDTVNPPSQDAVDKHEEGMKRLRHQAALFVEKFKQQTPTVQDIARLYQEEYPNLIRDYSLTPQEIEDEVTRLMWQNFSVFQLRALNSVVQQYKATMPTAATTAH